MPARRILTLDGQSMTISEWANKTGLARVLIHTRLSAGWTVEQALTTPKNVPPDRGMPDDHKQCSRCQKILPLSQFGTILRKNMRQPNFWCKECETKRVRDGANKLRTRVLNFYSPGEDGPICALCGESRVMALDLDHIKGGGFQERKDIGGSSIGVWRNALHVADKTLYRVLCRNCNWIEYLRRTSQGGFRNAEN